MSFNEKQKKNPNKQTKHQKKRKKRKRGTDPPFFCHYIEAGSLDYNRAEYCGQRYVTAELL